MKPLITIIIPSYNQAEYLPDAIESALSQTLKCDVIVVDDGSTDGSLEIARKYPVSVISQVNKGLASARNTGIMNADTEYILPLDSDDMLQDEAAQKISDMVKEHNPDIIGLSFQTFGMSRQPVFLLEQMNAKDFIHGNRLPYCSAIRRSALLEVGGYSPRMAEGYEDYHLWFDLLKRGKTVRTVQERMFLYRVREGSMISTAVHHHDKLMAQIMKDHKEVFE